MNILFFHRLDLTYLYGNVSKHLQESHRVIHVAFSDYEEKILRNEFEIKDKIYNFNELKDDYFNSSDFVDVESLDLYIRKNTEGRFCLSSSILIDRTYDNLSFDDACKLSNAYFKTWNYIFEDSLPNFFIHELPAVFFAHIAAIICKEKTIKFLTQNQVIGIDNYQWIFVEGDSAIPIEVHLTDARKYLDKVSDEVCLEFISKIKSDNKILYSDLIKPGASKSKSRNFTIILSVVKLFVREFFLKFQNKTVFPVKDHVNNYLKQRTEDFWIRLENIFFKNSIIPYHDFKDGEKFFFYPLHLEPEAVVLYYGEGWYRGQIKLIENIAMQLPPDTTLYVKDHPLFLNSRNSRDYKQLFAIKNVRLIDPKVPAKALIRNALGVITINGTAGFESIIMGKPVITFGNAYYNFFKGVNYVPNIKDLGPLLISMKVNQESLPDIVDVKRFLLCSHKGFVSFFSGRQNSFGLDLDDNAIKICNGFYSLIEKIEVE